ncbi:MAG: hypothetical protein ABEK16_04615 [Candidatus Nanohalobium sp.]
MVASALGERMYELKQNLEQPLEEGFGEDTKEEKRRCSVNLYEFQREQLDSLSEEKDISRNEILRRLLDIILGRDDFDLFFKSGKESKDGRC